MPILLRVPRLSAKKKCCKDTPRCSACPVVLKRITDAGYGERLSKRKYRVKKRTPSAVLSAARAR